MELCLVASLIGLGQTSLTEVTSAKNDALASAEEARKEQRSLQVPVPGYYRCLADVVCSGVPEGGELLEGRDVTLRGCSNGAVQECSGAKIRAGGAFEFLFISFTRLC